MDAKECRQQERSIFLDVEKREEEVQGDAREYMDEQIGNMEHPEFILAHLRIQHKGYVLDRTIEVSRWVKEGIYLKSSVYMVDIAHNIKLLKNDTIIIKVGIIVINRLHINQNREYGNNQ